MRLKFYLILALLVTAGSVPAAAQHEYTDSYPRNYGIDIVGYVFELTLSDDTDDIRGRTTVDARFVESGQSALRLDLVDMTVTDVTLGGESLNYAHENGALLIDLGAVVPAGERRRVVVEYEGTPTDGLDIGPNKYGDRTFFSDNWSSRVRHWLPVVDHPYDKATTEMIITAPDHYQAGSNGTLTEVTDLDGDMRRTHWVNPVPTATWLYFIGVADFAVDYVSTWNGVSIETWVYRQDRDAGFHDFAEPTEDVLAYYTDLIGPYVNRRLANVVSNATPGGGMEAASTPAYSDRSVSGNRDRRWQHVIIHEIAHQWFGNAVTEADWNDVWLSEGFATYYTLLFREHAYGHDDFIAGLENARSRVVDFYRETPDFQLVRPYIEDLNNVSGIMMYQKGAWILHMLREMLGHDVYDEGIRAYYAEFINRNARTADLRGHLEAASGKDLRWFFDQWLFQGGIPVLEGAWRAVDGGVQIGLRQVQDEAYRFRLPIEVAVRTEDGSETIYTIELPTSGRMRHTLEVDGDVTEVVIDPNTRLLADWTFTYSE
ncbi:MAG: M1 family metallopeptidase [Rhodothermales bacterium]|nr:M1 family metallopeptidase [Rhodothermales bacterium]